MKQNYKEELLSIYIFRPERLKRLADHLRQGPLVCPGKIEPVNIRVFEPNVLPEKRTPILIFPIYELLFIYPEQWGIDERGLPLYIEDDENDPISSVLRFFGINHNMFHHLFIPYNQNIAAFGGKTLSPESSAKDIAHNIYELIKAGRSFQIAKIHPIILN